MRFGATAGQESYVEAARAVLAERTSVTGTHGATAIDDMYELLGRPGPGGLFHGLDDDQMRRVLEASHVIECERGQQIVTSDHGTRTLYVVLDGDVEVVSRGVVVHRVGPGQPFGELAFLLSVKRTADVVAASERVQVLALSERVVQRLISCDGELAARLLENLSRALALRLIAASR